MPIYLFSEEVDALLRSEWGEMEWVLVLRVEEVFAGVTAGTERVVVSYPQTRTQVDVKWREYE